MYYLWGDTFDPVESHRFLVQIRHAPPRFTSETVWPAVCAFSAPMTWRSRPEPLGSRKPGKEIEVFSAFPVQDVPWQLRPEPVWFDFVADLELMVSAPLVVEVALQSPGGRLAPLLAVRTGNSDDGLIDEAIGKEEKHYPDFPEDALPSLVLGGRRFRLSLAVTLSRDCQASPSARGWPGWISSASLVLELRDEDDEPELYLAARQAQAPLDVCLPTRVFLGAVHAPRGGLTS